VFMWLNKYSLSLCSSLPQGKRSRDAVARDADVSLATEICCCNIWCCWRILMRMFWAITSGSVSICFYTHNWHSL